MLSQALEVVPAALSPWPVSATVKIAIDGS
jgi:hypothetical protein